MEKKTYIVPESTIEKATIQIVCEEGFASGGGPGDGTDGWAKKRNGSETSEKEDPTWGTIW